MGALAMLKYHYPQCYFTYSVKLKLASLLVFDLALSPLAADLCGRHSQLGSLAGAAHLLNDNASVLWCPKVSSMRTEISCGPKGEKLA